MQDLFKHAKNDLSAGLVVFFVAFPLCLGIALASGAPLFSGMIAGIVGGIVVGSLSGSCLGVSGPAAGLTIIVLSAIETLGSWNTFLLSVVIAGVIQVIIGWLRAGFIAYFFPSSVIKGMLSGIGLSIIFSQIPHAIGYDKNLIGDYFFYQSGGETVIDAMVNSLDAITPAAVVISLISIFILILWDKVLTHKHSIFKLIQGPIVVVVLGIVLNIIFERYFNGFSLLSEHLVSLPVSNDLDDFLGNFTSPNYSEISNFKVWQVAIVLAIVASIETLLCVEATDKLDPKKRITPTNRELTAQGVGNIVSGLIGGLPVTQVIVRSSANITFGAETKISTIFHGILLLISSILFAQYLNMLPLASLAAILIVIGYKLAAPSLFKQMYSYGSEQFVPFIATILGILFSDLLKGIAIGICFGIYFTLKHSYRNSYYMKDKIKQDDGYVVHHIVLAEEVSFFNKASIIELLNSIPARSTVIVDCSNSKSIARDVVEVLKDFKSTAKNKEIVFKTIAFIED